MTGEVDLMGVFIPALLAWMVLALALSSVLRGLLRRIGFYRLVWHAPLFDAALFLLLLGGITAAAKWISS